VFVDRVRTKPIGARPNMKERDLGPVKPFQNCVNQLVPQDKLGGTEASSSSLANGMAKPGDSCHRTSIRCPG